MSSRPFADIATSTHRASAGISVVEKLCGACTEHKGRTSFSKNQWDKKNRRCRDCAAQDLPLANKNGEDIKNALNTIAQQNVLSVSTDNTNTRVEPFKPAQDHSAHSSSTTIATTPINSVSMETPSREEMINTPPENKAVDTASTKYQTPDQFSERGPLSDSEIKALDEEFLSPQAATSAAATTTITPGGTFLDTPSADDDDDLFLSPELRSSIARVSELMLTPIDQALSQVPSIDAGSNQRNNNDNDTPDSARTTDNNDNRALTPTSKESLKSAVLALGSKLTNSYHLEDQNQEHNVQEQEPKQPILPQSITNATESSPPTPVDTNEDGHNTEQEDAEIEDLARSWQPSPSAGSVPGGEGAPLLEQSSVTAPPPAPDSIASVDSRWDRYSAGELLNLLMAPILDESGDARSVRAGIASLVLVGAMIGAVSKKNQDLPTHWYRTVSAMIGYIYFICWSVSFYPQVISNWKRKSTQGLSADFCVLNVVGFACYTAYNASFFWNPTIRALYKERYQTEVTVQSNDVAFAIHALVLSSITLCQIVYYRDSRPPSKVILGALVGILATCTIYPLFVVGGLYNWLDYLYVLSFIKVFISLIKYIPQVVLNHQRESTMGWSIWNILLDFTGGVLSDLQLILDCADMGDFSGITGNPAKLGLGFLSMSFDIVFMVQHYLLYPGDGHNEIGGPEYTVPLLAVEDQGDEEQHNGAEQLSDIA